MIKRGTKTTAFHNIKKYCLVCGKRLVLHSQKDLERKKFCSQRCNGKYLWISGKVTAHPLSEEAKSNMRRPHRITARLLETARQRGLKMRGTQRRGREINCAQCGRLFYVPECRFTGAAVKRQGPQKYCSTKCRTLSTRKPPEMCCDKQRLRQWSLAVLKRDKYKCVQCEEKDTKLLQAHHIIYKAKNKDHWYNVTNGKTLCAVCHAMAHIGENVEHMILLTRRA